MLRGNKNKLIIIMCACCLLLFIGIGYATLTTRLDIGGEANMTGKWDIRITNMVVTTKGIAKDISHSYDNASATFKVDLFAPGDSVEYTITIENKGNIKAALKQVTSTVDKEYSDVSLTNTLVNGEILEPGETMTFKVKSEFDVKATSLPLEPINLVYNIEVIYYQYEGNEIIMPPNIDTDNVCFTIAQDGTLGEYNYSCGLDVSVPTSIDGINVTKISINSFNNEKHLKSLGYYKVQYHELFSDYSGTVNYYYIFEDEEKLKKEVERHLYSSKEAAALNNVFFLVGDIADNYLYTNYWVTGFNSDGAEEWDNPEYNIYWYYDPVDFFIIESAEAYDAAVLYIESYGYDSSELYIAGDPNIPYYYREPLEYLWDGGHYYSNGIEEILNAAAHIEKLDLSSAIYLEEINSINRFENLTSLILPGENGNLKTIGNSAFGRCDLKSVTIPSTVTKIEYGAFGGMKAGSIIKINRRNSNGMSLSTGWNGKATVKYVG